MYYFYFKWIIYIHNINLSGIVRTTILSGKYERITRQLGDIENNIYFWFIILCSKFYLVTMEVGCVIFGMTPKKKTKRYERDNGLEGWNEVAVWREFKLPFISGDIWAAYIEHVTFEWFSRHSQSRFDNRNRRIHGSMTMHTGGSVSFSTHVKRMVRLI